jgi:phospholipid/cholesterol/gamma-HCH transport system ATP-binding protein
MTPVFRALDLRCFIAGAPLLKGVSFELGAGEALIIAGRSGCGKSVLLELCAGLIRLQNGEIFWEGKCLSGLTREELADARRRTGIVFQKHALIHNFTIFDNIALPLRYHTSMSERDIRICVQRCMDELVLFDVDRKFPNELSLSQTKSASLARALIMEPGILFADEPTAGADPFTETCITNFINHIRSEKKTAVIMTCNEVRTMRGMRCPIKVLDDGKLLGLHEGATTDDFRPALLKTLEEAL